MLLLMFDRPGPVYFRRAVGFTIKVQPDLETARVVMPRHGKSERVLELTRDELRAWMALDVFREWPLAKKALQRLDPHELMYRSTEPQGRATTGAPLRVISVDERTALRDGMGVTVSLIHGE